MKRMIKTALGLLLSVTVIFAFAGCGGSSPVDDATAALDKTFAALKSADLNALNEISEGEDTLAEATETLGSEDGTKAVLQSMFGHFEYTIGKGEQVDDTHVNLPVTVTNANMSKAVEKWFTDLLTYAMSNPDLANDEDALKAKTIEMLQTSVDSVAEGENGTVTKDITIPMELNEGKWEIGSDVDDGVLDAITGGFVEAMNKLQSATP